MKIGDRVFVHGYIDEIRKDIVIIRNNGGYFGTVPSEVVTGGLPSAQPEPDWDYSEETKQITLIVPEDVYDSAETIFLSVGHEGKFGIRGMVYSVQSSSSCVHENDSISRQAAIDAANRADYTGLTVEDVKKVTDEVVKELKKLPSAQPDNQTNLCDSCDYSYPDCPSKNDDVIFGNGIGNDNICACNKYNPSAQTEIIYCKKCKHWTRTCGDEQWSLGDCDVFDKHLVMCNGYCAWAERRTDG